MDNDTKEMLFALGITTTIGALTGLGLSFTALSPLVMSGIVAAVPAALFTCIIIYNHNSSKKSFFIGACLCAASFATGVGLAAAAMAILPGAVLGMGSAALAGALIAPISVIAGAVTAFVIESIAKKVNEHIISPIVEKCFSSKEEECNLPAK